MVWNGSERPTLIHSSILSLAKDASCIFRYCGPCGHLHFLSGASRASILLLKINKGVLGIYPELIKFVADLDEGMLCLTYAVEYSSFILAAQLIPISIESSSFPFLEMG